MNSEFDELLKELLEYENKITKKDLPLKEMQEQLKKNFSNSVSNRPVKISVNEVYLSRKISRR
jgi:hypothetical protein